MTETTLPRGLYAPVVTPFDADLAPDAARFTRLCQWLIDDGCHGLVLFGTTSEANSLSIDERIALTEAVVDAGIPADKLIVGTGMSAIPDTVALTAHAVGLGCAGVLVLPPFYYKGVSDAGLHAAYAEVIERVGDARLRMYLYHIPQVSGVAVSFALIESLLAAYPGTVVGIKDSTGDWDNTRALIDDFDGFQVFPGNELSMLDALKRGAVGCITATANINAAGLRRLYDNWQTPEAEALQAAAAAVRQAAQTQPVVPGLKQVVARLTEDPGWAAVRPPFEALDEVATRALFDALEAAGYAPFARAAA